MTGYIIGFVLGLVIFVLQNLKPTSLWFRISFLILTFAFLWGISYAHMGYWNILIIPAGVLALCFIAALCFPYGSSSARNEYMAVNGRNYYAELHSEDKIGRIDAPGLKQTYDRIIGGILTQIVSTQDDFQKLGNKLYSKNFFPISTHTKIEVMKHINSAIEDVAHTSKHGGNIQSRARNNLELLFNAYVSVMSIHEEATRQIEELENERSHYEHKSLEKYHIGDKVFLPMEDGGNAEGIIVSCENGLYKVRFSYAVSLIEKVEPEGGWSDNDWPVKELKLSDGTIDAIKQGYYIGTTCHYHF